LIGFHVFDHLIFIFVRACKRPKQSAEKIVETKEIIVKNKVTGDLYAFAHTWIKQQEPHRISSKNQNTCYNN